jgi:hypothetical protein
MNKFLKKISVYILFTILIYVGIFISVKVVNIGKYTYPVNNIKHNIVLFADSVGWQINTDSINISNLSFGSESYADIEQKIRFLVKEKKIKTAILTYDDHMLSSYRETINNNHRSIWLNSMNSYEIISNVILHRNEYIYVFQYGIIRRFKDYLNEKLYKKVETNIEENFNNLTDLEKIKSVNKKITQQYSKFSKSEISTFNRILKFCKKNNIEVVLIKFPLNSLFIKERNKNKLYQNNKRLINLDYQLIDFSKSLQDLSFYRDQNHLNESGKVEFIKLLKNNLN